jgi:hypothetical protein
MTNIILLTTVVVTQATDGTQMMRRLNPKFEELQSKFVGGQVIYYKGLPNKLIEKVLDKYFHHIEFMSFVNEGENK